jgi:hypothetical protein
MITQLTIGLDRATWYKEHVEGRLEPGIDIDMNIDVATGLSHSRASSTPGSMMA